MIRVLIADDSATVRNTLVALLAEDPRLSIVGQAADGIEAVDKARALRPDVVTMDVNMPRLDGLGATAAIMAEAPARGVVISSVSEHRQLELSFKATPEQAKLQNAGEVDVIGLVASTGGPPALAQVLAQLPASLPVPILLAQHIAQGFTPGLQRWFAGICALRIQIASDGAFVRKGCVYLAPDGCDLEVDGQGLLRTPPGTGLHCPSGNRLLHSLARVYGPRAAGFVLTGMGDDGAQGLLALRNAGGETFAQDEHTSIVFGMPQAAQACGAARSMLSLESIAHAILELCRQTRKPAWK